MPISITKLHPDKRNANHCVEETQLKLSRHISLYGFYPSLIVRPDPNNPGDYIIVDGHHRLLVLKKLGYEEVECDVWDVDDKQAAMYLATLNQLRGTDDYRKRAELIESLTEIIPVNDLAKLLPESESQINDMLSLLRMNEASLEEIIQKQIEKEKEMLPIPYTFMLSQQDATLVDQVLSNYPNLERSQQLIAHCKRYLEVYQNA